MSLQASQYHPEHLFIGYAIEDGVFARWLTLRLASEGYKVWCDQIKLLGGESYPRDIRKAIRESTFRFIAVISKSSIDKEHPLEERTLAKNVGLARKIDDFIIPLNLDGSRAEDLDLLTTAVTYIPFSKGWAGGFAQLLAKLAKVDSPRALSEGRQAVVSWLYAQQNFVEGKQERLWSNILPIVKFPKELRRYYVTNIPDAVKDNWPTYKKSRDVVWAFGPPGKEAPLNSRLTRTANWTTELEADDLDTFSIASGLLREAIRNYCVRKGMRFSEDGKEIYFPFGLLQDDKLTYKRFDGKTVFVKAVGRKTIRRRTGESQVSWYHIAPVFQPLLNRFGDPCYQINFRLVWTDREGVEEKVPTGRRRLKWYNYQWLARTFALISWLTDGKDSQDILAGDDFAVSISGRLLELLSQQHINEDSLGGTPEGDDDENEEIEEEPEEDENNEESQVQVEENGEPD
jgi:hypothetical protein